MSNKHVYDRSFSEETFGETIDSLNTVLDAGMLLESNFSGQIIENIKLPVGVDVAISHNLKVTPKYRIILRQSGALIITDGIGEWSDKKIYLRAESSGGASFSAGIGFMTSSNISPGVGGFNAYSGNYTTSGIGFDHYGAIPAAVLNQSLSSGTSSSEAIVTIILMRG